LFDTDFFGVWKTVEWFGTFNRTFTKHSQAFGLRTIWF